MERSLDRDRKALMEDLYLAEMASSPSVGDKKIIKNFPKITFDELVNSGYIYFNPIGLVDIIKTDIKFVPFTLNLEIDRLLNKVKKERWTYKVCVFYFGFTDEFTASKKLLEIVDLKNAVAIVQDNKTLDCRKNIKRKIIGSSDVFEGDLYWYAFWGFKKYEPLNRDKKIENNDSNSTNPKIDNQNA